MTKESRKSQLATEISEHRTNYDNAKLVALKAWDSKDWALLETTAKNLQYLDQTIKFKLYEIHKIDQEADREKLEAIS